MIVVHAGRFSPAAALTKCLMTDETWISGRGPEECHALEYAIAGLDSIERAAEEMLIGCGDGAQAVAQRRRGS